MSAQMFAMIKALELKVAELEARIRALEAKRGPGRPPNEKAA